LRVKEFRWGLDRLGKYLEGPVAKSVLPASKLSGAFNYIRNHWEALNEFVNDGALPIDNNQVERLMKRIAVGRKNWLFIGSLRARVRNASLMSLVAVALMDLDVGRYLESVLTHMLRRTAKTQELFPDRSTVAHRRGDARVPRARATRYGRYNRSASSTASGTSGAPQRQIASEDPCSQSHTHGYGSANRTPYKQRRVSVEYRLRPQCWLRRATNRSIPLEPLTGLECISKPELQSIYPS
jgi:hypothetical protein